MTIVLVGHLVFCCCFSEENCVCKVCGKSLRADWRQCSLRNLGTQLNALKEPNLVNRCCKQTEESISLTEPLADTWSLANTLNTVSWKIMKQGNSWNKALATCIISSTERLPMCYFFYIILFWDRCHITHLGLELPEYLRLAFNFWSSCVYLLSTGITGNSPPCPFYIMLEIEPRASHMVGKQFPNRTTTPDTQYITSLHQFLDHTHESLDKKCINYTY